MTDAAVTFVYGEQRIHMAAGEAWTFDPRIPHGFIYETDNRAADGVSSIACIHLVVETKGSARLTELLRQSEQALPRPRTQHRNSTAAHTRHVRPHRGTPDHLALEPYAFEVLTPQKLCKLMALMLLEIKESQISPAEFARLVEHVEQFQQRWQQTFDRFGHRAAGELAYQDLLLDFQEQIVRKATKWAGEEGKYVMAVVRSMLQTAPAPKRTLRKQLGQRIQLQRQKKSAQILAQQGTFCAPDFDRPLFIVSAPRAGSTLLFETLRHFPGLWTTGEESHELIENMPSLHPAAHDYQSNRLTTAAATPEIAARLRQRFGQQLQDRTEQLLIACPQGRRPTCVRFLEKMPKNALRIPFLKAIFPAARFLFLYRDPGANISSMIEGWRTRRFIAYKPLPGWPTRDWSFLLVPDWQSVIDRPLVEIAAYQWQMANAIMLDDLATLPRST